MTRINRDIRNGWQAETRFAMPEIGERHFLQLHTMKRYDGTVATAASICQRTEDGYGYTHRMGFAGEGDYRRTVVSDKVRCTEKAVREQHALALQQIDQIKADALAFHGNRVPA